MPVNYVTFRKQTCATAQPLHCEKHGNKKYRNNDLRLTGVNRFRLTLVVLRL